MKGRRKMIVFYVGAGVLLAGLGLCAFDRVAAAYGAFATGVGSLVAAFMAGNAAEHFAAKDSKP